MITKQQAEQIAKRYIPEADTCIDEPKAYIFTIKSPTPNQMDDNEVVVLKSNGKVISYIEYITSVN